MRETRRRFRHGLVIARDRRLRNARRRRDRLGDRFRPRLGLRLRLGLRVGNRRHRHLDLVLPRRDVLDGRLVRLRRGRLLGGGFALLLPLRCLGGLEELGERALTHARALSRH
jgi:hypothetical protein